MYLKHTFSVWSKKKSYIVHITNAEFISGSKEKKKKRINSSVKILSQNFRISQIDEEGHTFFVSKKKEFFFIIFTLQKNID